jgi:hypothetical protein
MAIFAASDEKRCPIRQRLKRSDDPLSTPLM